MPEWLWPVRGVTGISSPYGERSGGFHYGLDISDPGDSDLNAPILASKSGNIIRSEWSDSYGNVIYIDHGGGWITVYAHLNRIAPSASNGSRVGQGDVIGYLGSTGHSSGPHLHFEIRRNGNAVNPQNYVTPNNTPVTNPIPEDTGASPQETPGYTGDPTQNTGLNTGLGTVPYTPDAVYANRVAEFTSQPMFSFIRLSVGDVELTTIPAKPNILMSLEFTKIEEAGSTGTITIFDDNWEDIELVLAAHWDNIYLEYGYSDYIGSNVRSNKYQLYVMNYMLKFNETGVILTIDLMSQGVYMNQEARSVSTDSKNPRDAIMQICKDIGLVVLEENFDYTEPIEDMDYTFSTDNDQPITYILEQIVPYAKNSEGDIFSFYVDSNNVAYLKKRVPGSTTSVPTSKNDIKTYVYQKGYDSVVQELDFDIKGVFGGTAQFQTATELHTNCFGIIDKSDQAYSIRSSDVVTTATGRYTHTDSNQSSVSVDSAGDSYTQTKNKLYYHVKNATDEAYEATMTIVGDPSLNLLDDIRIINMTDRGYYHHTSGIYMIVAITDYIDDGNYTTTLKLVRNGDINDGIELLNTKILHE